MDFSNLEAVREKYPYYPDSIMMSTEKFAKRSPAGFNGLFACCGVRGAQNWSNNLAMDYGGWVVPILRKASEPMEAPHRGLHDNKRDGVRVLDYDDKGNPVTAFDIFWVDA